MGRGLKTRVLRDQRCTLRAAHYARTLLHLLAIPSRLCLTWLRLSLKISNASSVMRGGGGDACVDGNRRDSGGMLHACLRMKVTPGLKGFLRSNSRLLYLMSRKGDANPAKPTAIV